MTPKALFQRLEQVVGAQGHPRRLRETLEAELQDFFSLNPLQAAEKAEKLEASVRNLISRRVEQCEHEGLLPVLVLSDASYRSIAGSCWPEETDPPEVLGAKKRRVLVEHIINQIRALTFHEFECFGARLLRELGASSVRVTPHSSDQGIDFYGIFSLGDTLSVPSPFCQLAHDIELQFVGQAKHYPTRAIGPHHIRELAGSILLARYKVFTKEPELFGDLSLQAFNPMVSLLFTTGRFTKGAAQIASEAGIIARSVGQLATFLADRGVGISEFEDRVDFNEDLFRVWLSGS